MRDENLKLRAFNYKLLKEPIYQFNILAAETASHEYPGFF